MQIQNTIWWLDKIAKISRSYPDKPITSRFLLIFSFWYKFWIQKSLFVSFMTLVFVSLFLLSSKNLIIEQISDYDFWSKFEFNLGKSQSLLHPPIFPLISATSIFWESPILKISFPAIHLDLIITIPTILQQDVGLLTLTWTGLLMKS